MCENKENYPIIIPVSFLIRSTVLSCGFTKRYFVGETYFSTEAAAVLEELTQGKLLQAQVVGKAEDGIPYVHIYQISGNNTSVKTNIALL